MNSLLFKMGAQWALERIGEGTTMAGLLGGWLTTNNIVLNPQVELNLINGLKLIICAVLIGMKEGWHKRTA